LAAPGSSAMRDLARIGFLSVFATRYRYPKQGGRLPPEPDWARVDEVLAVLESILGIAGQHFGLDLCADDRVPGANGAPIRSSLLRNLDAQNWLGLGSPSEGSHDLTGFWQEHGRR
jgi:hypothetical protein